MDPRRPLPLLGLTLAALAVTGCLAPGDGAPGGFFGVLLAIGVAPPASPGGERA